MSPEHVINGWNRAVGGRPNAWASDPAQKLPQWVQLDFPQPVAIAAVHVSFLSRARSAAAFRIDLWRDGAWHPVAEAGKRQRRHVLTFPRATAERLRLVILRAAAGYGVTEIRAYGKSEAAGPSR